MTQKITTNTTKERSALRRQLSRHYANLAAVQNALDNGVQDHWIVNPGEPDEYLEFSEARRPMTDKERRTANWTIERLRAQILDLGQRLFAADTHDAEPSHPEPVAA